MRPPVLRECPLIVTRLERELLPVTDDAEAVGGDAERDEICARRDGAPFTQRQIVLGRAALVAVTFDGDGPGRVALQRRRVGVQHRLRVAGELAAVVLEEDRLQRRVAIEVVNRGRRDRVVPDRLGGGGWWVRGPPA